MPSKKVSMRSSLTNKTSIFGIMGGLYTRKISGRSSMNRVTSRLEIPASAKEGYQYMKIHNLLSRNPLGSGGVGKMFRLRAGGSSGLGKSSLGKSSGEKEQHTEYPPCWGGHEREFCNPPSYCGGSSDPAANYVDGNGVLTGCACAGGPHAHSYHYNFNTNTCMLEESCGIAQCTPDQCLDGSNCVDRTDGACPSSAAACTYPASPSGAKKYGLDTKSTEKRVVTYVTSWGVAPADFWPAKHWLPPLYVRAEAGVWGASQNKIWKTLLTNTTHIMFAFGVNYPSIDSVLPCTSANLKGLLDVNMNPAFMAQIRAIRHQTNSNAKMLLSIGGGVMDAGRWKTCIGGKKPTDFDNAANAFWDVVHYLGLDGIDIDIEVAEAAIFTKMLEAFIRTRPSRSTPLSTVPLLITAAPDIRQLAPSATDVGAVTESKLYIDGLKRNEKNIDFINIQNYNGTGAGDSPGCAPYGTNTNTIFEIAKSAMNKKANKVVSMVCSDGYTGCDWGCKSKSASGMEIDKDDSEAAYYCSPHGRSGAGQPFDAKQLICQYKDYDSGNGGFGYWSANIGNTNTPTGAQLAVELTNAIKSVREAEGMCPASVCADTGTSNY
jgi:hypothetical protein